MELVKWCGKGSISIWGRVKDPNFHIFEGGHISMGVILSNSR